MSEIRINGSRWKNTDFTANAVELFKIRMKESTPYDTYKGVNGVVVFKLLRSSTEDIYMRDIMVQFATKSQTDETPYIKVFDMNKDENDSLDFKVIMDGDYAKVYAKASHKWDSVTYQIVFASQPSFVEDTYDTVTIPLSEYNSPSGESWGSANKYRKPIEITFNSNKGQSSTESNTHGMSCEYLTGTKVVLKGSMFIFNTVNAGDVLFTLSKGILGKNDVIYADVYENYPTGASPTFRDKLLVRRVPLELCTNGEVKALQDISIRSSMKINVVFDVRREK